MYPNGTLYKLAPNDGLIYYKALGQWYCLDGEGTLATLYLANFNPDHYGSALGVVIHTPKGA